jgi:hypothetical protein
MVAKALRAALFSALVLALWTFARPASAATFAPFCDDRGATALAPPPTLEPTDEALLRLAAPSRDASDDGSPTTGSTVVPARRLVSSSASELAAVRPLSLPAISPSPTTPLVSFEPAAVPHPGVRFRIERPPRG